MLFGAFYVLRKLITLSPFLYLIDAIESGDV